ncbi:hypothetical protein [Anaerotignum sp.]|uniref:hypothetical protein n=1 Tax=Anaerotignum sp. TaxID=2039241 RepID=UPI00373546A6
MLQYIKMPLLPLPIFPFHKKMDKTELPPLSEHLHEKTKKAEILMIEDFSFLMLTEILFYLIAN